MIYDICKHISVCAQIQIKTCCHIHSAKTQQTGKHTGRYQHISEERYLCPQEHTNTKENTGQAEGHQKAVHNSIS